MEVIVRIIKTNPWTGLTKWSTCYDYVSSYWTRSGNIYTGLTAEDAERLEKEIGFEQGKLAPNSAFWDTFAVKIGTPGTFIISPRPRTRGLFLSLISSSAVKTAPACSNGVDGTQLGNITK